MCDSQTIPISQQLLHSQPNSPFPLNGGKASTNLVQQWADASNFAIHPLTGHY